MLKIRVKPGGCNRTRLKKVRQASMNILTNRQKINNLFEALELPDPMKSFEDWEKFLNIDLDRMTELTLWREGRRIEYILSLLDPKVMQRYYYLNDRGDMVTAEGWATGRLNKIKQKLRQPSVSSPPRRLEGWI